jgi:hypothetical protein
MSVTSDPFLRAADPRPLRERWSFITDRQPLVARANAVLPAPRPIAARILAKALVIGAAGLLALRAIGGWIAEPLAPDSAAAPTWNVEVSSTSTGSVLAFAYSRESGAHLLRVPGRNADRNRRVIPARIAAGDLHVISLGWGQLDVRGRGPRGSRLKSYSATARAVTVFDRPDGTGVRTAW